MGEGFGPDAPFRRVSCAEQRGVEGEVGGGDVRLAADVRVQAIATGVIIGWRFLKAMQRRGRSVLCSGQIAGEDVQSGLRDGVRALGGSSCETIAVGRARSWRGESEGRG